jgi:hypothetical protein
MPENTANDPTVSAHEAAPDGGALHSFRRSVMKTFLSLASVVLLASFVGPFASAQHYTQVNLVANVSGVAPVTDPHLINPWGLSRTSGSPWWISDNGTGLSTLYNGAGAITPLVVTIPKANPNSKTFPTALPPELLLTPVRPTSFWLRERPLTFSFPPLTAPSPAGTRTSA